MKLLDYTVKAVDGKEYPLKEHTDKVWLIVNTASEWGLNSQLGELQKLFEKYREKGLMIFGFPCNQFADLEPRNSMDILDNYKEKFDVNYPLSKKIKVNGKDTDPLYAFLKAKGKDEKLGSLKEKSVFYSLLKEKHPEYMQGKELRWNYTKFLVADGGEIIERYEPSIGPRNIEHRIKKLLDL